MDGPKASEAKEVLETKTRRLGSSQNIDHPAIQPSTTIPQRHLETLRNVGIA